MRIQSVRGSESKTQDLVLKHCTIVPHQLHPHSTHQFPTCGYCETLQSGLQATIGHESLAGLGRPERYNEFFLPSLRMTSLMQVLVEGKR